MSPDGTERRSGVGRRNEDFCGDHKWLVEAVVKMDETVDQHTLKLNKFLGRVNSVLITFCLVLLGVIGDIILRWHKLGG